ncbi:MAG: PP0621 family protein [Thauera sp.]|nr:PP0621 family protein [Thauera sp.]
MRNLLIIALVFIGIWWARGALRRFKDQQTIRRKTGGKPVAAERMRECAHCGLIVPESEGVRGEDDFFCCEAHRRAGRRTE